MKFIPRLTGVTRSALLLRALLCILLSVTFASAAQAGAKRKPAVLYLHSDSFLPANVADVKNKLFSTGLFSKVDVFDGSAATPTLAQLNAYDAVLVTNDAAWASGIALGNVMAQYVDGGGGVVQSVFTTAGSGGSNLAGSWTAGYNCITFGPATSGTVATLGAITNQNHPTMIGVETFNGGSISFRPNGTGITPGATLIASWSDGKPLVVVGPMVNRCDLGFYPPSSDGQPGCWVSSTDGLKLLANSLLYVMRPKVLLVSADSAGWPADVQTKLRATGTFSQVDLFDASAGTPTLAQLQQYDAAMTWSNASYNNAAALGNVLADFVDAGGGVVSAVFADAETLPARRPGGRWISGGYEIIPGASGFTTGAATLGAVAYASHPIMSGVASFSGGAGGYRPVTTAVNPGGLIVVKWSDGKTLAAVSTRMPNRADLGMFPPSSAVNGSFWTVGTNGDKLMANALLYTIRPYIACASADTGLAPDVVAKLQATRRFSGVGNIDVNAATPALATLSPFSAVTSWSNAPYSNSTAMGTTLADYVDAGGGVVTSMFAVIDPGAPTYYLGGRWVSQGYEIVPSPLPAFTAGPPAFLGTIVEPAHPISSFVRKFDGGVNSYRANSTPLLRGRTIMKWNDGKMLASVHNFRKAASLGYWLSSNNGGNNGWNQRTDGTWIAANAIEFVVRVKPCPGDFNGDGQVDDTDFVMFAGYYDALVDPRGDLNGDGLTDDADFVTFAGAYDALVCP